MLILRWFTGGVASREIINNHRQEKSLLVVPKVAAAMSSNAQPAAITPFSNSRGLYPSAGSFAPANAKYRE
jgi:hypothetical protein